MDCITPSHPTPIPHGKSYDIYELLALPDAKLDPETCQNQIRAKWRYHSRKPALERFRPNLEYLDAQITRGERKVIADRRRSTKR
jgi:DNA polymerase gamma 1